MYHTVLYIDSIFIHRVLRVRWLCISHEIDSIDEDLVSTLTVFNTFKDAVLRDSVYDAAVLIETPLIKDGLKKQKEYL